MPNLVKEETPSEENYEKVFSVVEVEQKITIDAPPRRRTSARTIKASLATEANIQPTVKRAKGGRPKKSQNTNSGVNAETPSREEKPNVVTKLRSSCEPHSGVVREVTAMLDDDLVIPETDITAEEEVVLGLVSGRPLDSDDGVDIIGATGITQMESDEGHIKVNQGQALKIHYMPERTIDDELQCSTCGLALPTFEEYNQHASTHVPVSQRARHKCYICNKVLSGAETLLKHLVSHEGAQPYRCDHPRCKRGFKTQEQLDAHWGFKHGGDASVLTCQVCGKACKKLSELKAHMRVHTDERPYTCPIEGCGMRFKQSGQVKIHVRQHTGEKPYQCATCGKGFKQIANYREHQIRHNPELDEGRKFLCVYCGKSYKKMYTLKEHQRQHTGDTLQCKVCGKMFSHKTTLRNHMVTHQENRAEYKCDHCDRKFLSKQSCQQHEARHGDPEFKCTQCNKEFINATVLKQHKDRIHKGIRKFDCTVCGKKLATSWSLSKHMWNHERHDLRHQRRKQLISAMKEKDESKTAAPTGYKPSVGGKSVKEKPGTQSVVLDTETGQVMDQSEVAEEVTVDSIGQVAASNQSSGDKTVSGDSVVMEVTEGMTSLAKASGCQGDKFVVTFPCASAKKTSPFKKLPGAKNVLKDKSKTPVRQKADRLTNNVVLKNTAVKDSEELEAQTSTVIFKANTAYQHGDVLYVFTEGT